MGITVQRKRKEGGEASIHWHKVYVENLSLFRLRSQCAVSSSHELHNHVCVPVAFVKYDQESKQIGGKNWQESRPTTTWMYV